MDQEQEAWTAVLLASLRAENTQLWEIVRAVADTDCTYYDDLGIYCIFQCDGHDDLEGLFHHTDTCPAAKARALVEQARRGKGKGK